MRIVMMGTGPFAVPTFQALLDSRHDVVCLFTQPQRPARGKRPAPPTPMRDAADGRVPIYDPANINEADAQQLLGEQRADLLVVCDYGQILKETTLGLAKHGGINLHGSILPKYRGAAPINWAIYNGDPETGITVIHMTPTLDGGPCLKVVRTPIEPEENAIDVEVKLSHLGVAAVLESLVRLEEHPGEAGLGEIQQKSEVSKAPRLKKTDADVDWTRSAQQIYNQYRAFQPWPGCYTYFAREGKLPLRVILNELKRPTGDSVENNVRPGEIVRCEEDVLQIATGQGLLQVLRLQPAGKKSMSASEFLRGYQPAAGDRFVSESQVSD